MTQTASPHTEATIVTNGVHLRSWVSIEMTALLVRYLGPRWAEEDPDSTAWHRIGRIPDEDFYFKPPRRSR